MTIKERYAKYTIEEIKAGISKLQNKIADDEMHMEMAKKAKDIEAYKIAKTLHDNHYDLLMDAECALNSRIK